MKITWVSNYRCPIWTFSNRTPVIGHPRDRAPITWQIGARRTNHYSKQAFLKQNNENEIEKRTNMKPSLRIHSRLSFAPATILHPKFSLRVSRLVARANEKRLYSQATWIETTHIFFLLRELNAFQLHTPGRSTNNQSWFLSFCTHVVITLIWMQRSD